MTFILIVTGGGRGIGAETSLRAAEAGWESAATGRTPAAHGTRAGWRRRAGVLIVQADIGSEADILRLFEPAGRAWDAVRTGNSAGIQNC